MKTTPENQSKYKSRKTAGLLAVAVFLFLGLLVVATLIRTGSEKSEPTTQSSSAAQLQAGKVDITSEGFVPATITIKVGDTITWTNQDKDQHQVTTDPHPTHDGLPGFEAKTPTANKSSYSYRFDKAGSYTYHDHLNPLKFQGTVVVQ